MAKGRKGELAQQEEFLKTMRGRFQAAYEFEQDNRDEMYDDVKFSYGGEHQWDRETYQNRVKDDRPALTINRVKTPIRQVSNDIRLNKPSIKIAPCDDKSDKAIAKIYEGLIRNIEVNSMASVAYQTAADGAIRCGFGAFEIRNVYNNDDSFEQDLVIKRILNQFSVYFDPSAKEITREDANWAFITEQMTEEAFKRKYPQAAVSSWEGNEREYDLWFNDQVRIGRYYVKEPITKELVQFSDGTVCEKTKEQIDSGMFESGELKIVNQRTVKTHKVMCYVVSGADILEKPYEVPGKYIPIIPVLGEETIIEGELKLSGIVRDAKDPQRLYNYWRTTAAETIALQPKAPWLVTAKMVEGVTGHWNQANKANLPYLLYKFDEQAGKPVREPPPQPPAAMWQESAIASDDVKFTTGIFDSGLGQIGPEQSGKAILARQQKSDLGNFIYTDNLSIAIRHAGKVLIEMIPKIYDTQRVIRVLNPDDTDEMVEINKAIPGTDQKINDITIGKYDVTVSTGPSYQTKRQEAAASILAFMGAVPDKAPIMSDLAAKNMDWPGSDEVAKRIRKTIDPALLEGELDEEEMQQQQARAEAEAAQNEMIQQMQALQMAETDSKRQLNIAKAQETLASIDQKELENLFNVLQATQGGRQ